MFPFPILSGRQNLASAPGVTGFTWSPTNKGGTITLASSNLDAQTQGNAGDLGAVFGTVGKSSGKWYFETKIPNNCSFGTDHIEIGVAKLTPNNSTTNLSVAGSYIIDKNSTSALNAVFNGSGAGSTGTAWSSGQVIAFALDVDAGTLDIYQNNTLTKSATGLAAGTYYPCCLLNDSGGTLFDVLINQTNTYAAPAGFSVLA